MNWTLAVIIISIALALLFTWQEVRRADKRRLAWRLLAVWLAVGALACVILPVSYNTQIDIADGTEAVLLTDGFDKDSIPANVPAYTLDKTVKKAYASAKLISSVKELANHQPAFKKVKIEGYGLSKDELQQLVNLPVSFSAPTPTTGLKSVSWPTKIKTGEVFSIQGSYLNKTEKPVKLLLKGLNTSLDSADIAPGTAAFQLNTTPKPTGRVVYHLLALSGADTLSYDAVPFQVIATQPVKVLMLNAAPNFENRFLKNWLGENGYAVASRALISKDKSSTEFVNMDKLNLRHINTSVLNKFDLVIGDLSTLKSLSPADAATLRNEVTQKGLGVIVRADSSDKAASWLQRDFPVTTLDLKEQLSVPLTLQGKTTKTAKLSIDPSYIVYRSNTQTLASDAQNRGLAAVTIAGAGKVAFTTLNHTYSWLLSGNTNGYAALWSLLINQSARELPPAQSWKVTTVVPNSGQPTEVVFEGAAGTIAVNGQIASPLQNQAIPYQWHSTYRAQATGWQEVSFNAGNKDWFYNYAPNEWKSIKNQQKTKETRAYLANRTQKQLVTKQIQQNTRMEVPKIWFYMILLVACTFLWVERKFAIQL